MKSLSTASHFKLSCAVVSQVMSLVRSLLSLLDLSGFNWMLRSGDPSCQRQATACLSLCLNVSSFSSSGSPATRATGRGAQG